MNRTQLMAMLWLRWRLTRNQWRRGGEIGAVITMVVTVIGLCLAAAGGVAGIAGGAMGLSHASPQVTMLVWDGLVVVFLLFWTLGLVSELQRSELIDLSRLLHLPVSLRDVFLLNYLASHLCFSLALMMPAMLGLAIGLMAGRGVAMALLLPLVFGFFFMISAWTYCLRGWLASLMVNKRRRRAIVMGITMAIVLLSQLPNLIMNPWFRGDHDSRPTTPSAFQEQAARNSEKAAQMRAVFDQAHIYVPFLWLPQGARALREGQPWPAVWGAFGMIAIGMWGLMRAYRATLRFYQGGETSQPAAPASKPVADSGPVAGTAAVTGRKLFIERTLPGIPEEASAVMMASLRSISRAPEIKMALTVNVVIFAILGVSMLLRRSGGLPSTAQPFMASAAVAATFMGLAELMFNHFGFDRGGFRALVLLPAPRRSILQGKNLALLPVALVIFAIYLLLAAVAAHLGVAAILAAGFEFGFAFLALSAVGNLISVLFPYRISAGSLKPTKMKGTTHLMIILTNLMFPLAMAPVFLPAWLGMLAERLNWLPGSVVTLLCAVLLAALAALFYWLTLGPLGDLLQRREQKILQVVTQEVE